MTVQWSNDEIAKILNAQTQGSWKATGVNIDSRKVQPGELFFALETDTADGHNYVNNALIAEAAAIVISKMPARLPKDAPYALVKNTMQALRDLGAYQRNQMHGKVIGVTGSVGKTGTKQAIMCALSAIGQTHASAGNFNNHLGVPISLCRMDTSSKFGVFEMGMNHKNEIAELTLQVKPHVAVITAIDAVHLEFFNSVKEIADAKAEIFLNMPADSIALLPRDSEYFEHLVTKAQGQKISKIFSFGIDNKSDYQLLSFIEEGDHYIASVKMRGKEFKYKTKISGKHRALNSLSALAVVDLLGHDYTKSAKAIETLEPYDGRGKVICKKIDKYELHIFDESYNASPVAMKAGLEVFGEYAHSHQMPSIAVIGDMGELGNEAINMHTGLNKSIVGSNITKVIAIGTMMKNLYNTLPDNLKSGHYDNSNKLTADLFLVSLKELGNSNKIAIFIKGSLSTNMKVIKEMILNINSL